MAVQRQNPAYRPANERPRFGGAFPLARPDRSVNDDLGRHERVDRAAVAERPGLGELDLEGALGLSLRVPEAGAGDVVRGAAVLPGPGNGIPAPDRQSLGIE